jgi:hypothetical protein
MHLILEDEKLLVESEEIIIIDSIFGLIILFIPDKLASKLKSLESLQPLTMTLAFFFIAKSTVKPE